MPTHRALLARILTAAAACLALLRCDKAPTEVNGLRPPYLAIVVSVDAPPEITVRGPYTFRVRELTGVLPIDTVIRATPNDTIILSVTAATYRVDIGDVPPTCGVRYGTAQSVAVQKNINTAILRFYITCTPALVVTANTGGAKQDSDYVLTVKGERGEEYATVMKANKDTIRIEGLPAGKYEVSLRHVSSNCFVISNGGATLQVNVAAGGGTFVPFLVACSDEAKRPRISQFVGTYLNGTIAYVIRATDPDKDIERTSLFITDCNQNSLLGAGRQRNALPGSVNVARRDTAIIIGAYDLEVADSALTGRCLGVWIGDMAGNTSEFKEVPLLKRDAARSPLATLFNARLNGVKSVVVDLAVSDPDNDFLGTFCVYLLRDGIVAFPPDAKPDRLIFEPGGLLGTTIPELPVGIGFGAWSDYLGAIIVLVDKAGNFTRLEDNDLYR